MASGSGFFHSHPGRRYTGTGSSHVHRGFTVLTTTDLCLPLVAVGILVTDILVSQAVRVRKRLSVFNLKFKLPVYRAPGPGPVPVETFKLTLCAVLCQWAIMVVLATVDSSSHESKLVDAPRGARRREEQCAQGCGLQHVVCGVMLRLSRAARTCSRKT
jgi:hypothetical protein